MLATRQATATAIPPSDKTVARLNRQSPVIVTRGSCPVMTQGHHLVFLLLAYVK